MSELARHVVPLAKIPLESSNHMIHIIQMTMTRMAHPVFSLFPHFRIRT
jgi:hypothetical protein